MTEIILASSSARRQEMMSWLGVPFEIVPSNFEEEAVRYSDFEDPDDYVATIATGKALAVSAQHPDALIIASDTMVFLLNKVYGKPKNLEDARAMIRELRGNTHTVVTAVVMIDGITGEKRAEIVKSEVTFFEFGWRICSSGIRKAICTGSEGECNEYCWFSYSNRSRHA